jgi:hypothetical protein
MLTRFAAACGFLALLVAPAAADERDRKTIVTVNEPIIIAGVPQVTLQPGKYLFRIMNFDHTRNIISVFNEDGNKHFTTVLAINNYRLFPKDRSVFTFWETPQGNPAALKAWFFPGDNMGQEFVYPSGLAARIAKETGQPVPAVVAQTPAQLETAPIQEVEKTGEEHPFEVQAAPAPEPVVIAQARPEPAAEPVRTEPAPVELPKTASPYFLIGLAGLGTMAAGWAARRIL